MFARTVNGCNETVSVFLWWLQATSYTDRCCFNAVRCNQSVFWYNRYIHVKNITSHRAHLQFWTYFTVGAAGVCWVSQSPRQRGNLGGGKGEAVVIEKREWNKDNSEKKEKKQNNKRSFVRQEHTHFVLMLRATVPPGGGAEKLTLLPLPTCVCPGKRGEKHLGVWPQSLHSLGHTELWNMTLKASWECPQTAGGGNPHTDSETPSSTCHQFVYWSIHAH